MFLSESDWLFLFQYHYCTLTLLCFDRCNHACCSGDQALPVGSWAEIYGTMNPAGKLVWKASALNTGVRLEEGGGWGSLRRIWSRGCVKTFIDVCQKFQTHWFPQGIHLFSAGNFENPRNCVRNSSNFVKNIAFLGDLLILCPEFCWFSVMIFCCSGPMELAPESGRQWFLTSSLRLAAHICFPRQY